VREAITETRCPKRSSQSQLDVRAVLSDAAHANAALFGSKGVSHVALDWETHASVVGRGRVLLAASP
jgi:hypothetical protein